MDLLNNGRMTIIISNYKPRPTKVRYREKERKVI